ncbi:MarR family transcriptional regulator [Halioxenophilus sp. WMMB6]|uniref:MarR family winged helix-turn-helix transcriptional regulator n=1 Tax=Halioxenophilus sp. WMMB6 TaxID=3073815 RepID=UPI00295EE1FC|nr:MarR family transcriptional regulator [Halioxenophilus sp. WMMB6]
MEDSVGVILADVSRLMRRAFNEKARNIGITRPQWYVLTTLKRNEGINQGGLAEILDIEPITLCRILDRLQQAELVERRRDPADRRVWRLYLLPKAEQLLTQLRPLGVEVNDLALEGLDESAREQFRSTLKLVRQNLARRTEQS